MIRPSNKWEHYLTRPFNLFETSIWHQWYDSKHAAELAIRMKHARFEQEKNMSVHFRPARDLEAFRLGIKSIAGSDKMIQILLEGHLLNEQAQDMQAEDFRSYAQAKNFLIELAVKASIAPFFVLEHIQDEKRQIHHLAKELREQSYYPKIMELVKKRAEQELALAGIPQKYLPYLTTQELEEKRFSQVFERARDVNKRFVYTCYEGEEHIKYEKIAIKNIDQDIQEMRGQVACKGKVQGRVKIINTLKKGITFEKGDILISVSTNPALLPIIKKSGAIITDEGGITSHASIISRELNIPCIVGTKNATLVFKDGDLVEVDAESGIVRKL